MTKPTEKRLSDDNRQVAGSNPAECSLREVVPRRNRKEKVK